MTPLVEVNGRKDGHRYFVQVDGNAVYLTGVLFRVFAVLALERVRPGGDGWVGRGELHGSPGNASRCTWLVRQEVREALASTTLGTWGVVEGIPGGPRRGKHRLMTLPENVTFPNLQALIDFGDEAITSRLRGPGRCL